MEVQAHHVYRFTPFNGGKNERVHKSWLLDYHVCFLEQPLPTLVMEFVERTEYPYKTIQSILDVGPANDWHFLLIQWDVRYKRNYT